MHEFFQFADARLDFLLRRLGRDLKAEAFAAERGDDDYRASVKSNFYQ